jgi:hypothetical protein
MNNITNFPTKFAPDQLEQTRAWLAQVLRVTSHALLEQRHDLLSTDTATEFAEVVHSTAEILAEASEKWGALSNTIREELAVR